MPVPLSKAQYTSDKSKIKWKDAKDDLYLSLNFQERVSSKAEDEEYADVVWHPVPFILNTWKNVPFGYELNPEHEIFADYPHIDPYSVIFPIPEELVALEKAKKLIKHYSYGSVARWLSETTGRNITHDGLRKRIALERAYTTKAIAARKWAGRLKKAVEAAEALESSCYGYGRRLHYDEWGERLTKLGRTPKDNTIPGREDRYVGPADGSYEEDFEFEEVEQKKPGRKKGQVVKKRGRELDPASLEPESGD